jgi:hypothetical protein
LALDVRRGAIAKNRAGDCHRAKSTHATKDSQNASVSVEDRGVNGAARRKGEEEAKHKG